jgi:hypothetical protein
LGYAGLDAETKIYVLLVTGVGVEVVGGPAVELVTLAEFPSDEQAESYRSKAGGDPAYGLDQCGLFFLPFMLPGKGRGAGEGDVLGWGDIGARWGAKHHHLDDSSGVWEIGESVVLLRCRFCVIGLLTLNVRKGRNLSMSTAYLLLDRCNVWLEVTQILIEDAGLFYAATP